MHLTRLRRAFAPLTGLAGGLLVALALTLPAFAQFGHPLKGTWSGDRGTSDASGTSKGQRSHLVLEFNWDGKAITGTINPGPNAVPMQKATLDPDTWTVHVEADGTDRSGKATHYVVDGKMENIGAYQRVLSGTWTENGTKGDFRVVRN